MKKFFKSFLTLLVLLIGIGTNAWAEVVSVTTENAQAALDAASEGATIELSAGTYDVLYLRNTGTAQSNRIVKDVTIKAASGATVNVAQIYIVGRDENSVNKYIDVENLTIDGITFNVPEKSAVLSNVNSDGTVRINGLTVQNCVKVGNNSDGTTYDNAAFVGMYYDDEKTAIEATYAGDNTLTRGYHNIKVLNNTITNVYQPIKFPNEGPLYGLTVTGNTFTGCQDNHMMLSTKTAGTVIISNNTIVGMTGRFARISGAQSDAVFTLSGNTVTSPKKYDTGDDGSIVKITGTKGFSVTDNNNGWTAGTFTDANNTTWIAMGDAEKLYVAKIGETKYTTLADAFAAVSENGTATIMMINDASFSFDVKSYATIGAGQNITLDLNGKKIITGTSLTSATQLFLNDGTFTIKDSQTSGSITHGADPTWVWDGSNNFAGSYASNLITNTGTLTITNGTLTNISTGSAAYVIDNNSSAYSANATINGGTLTASADATIRMFMNSSTNENNLVINDGFVNATYYAVCLQGNSSATCKGHLTINGGEFESSEDSYNCSVAGWAYLTGPNSNAIVEITGGRFHDNVCITPNITALISGGLFATKEATIGSNHFVLQDGVVAGKSVIANTDASTKDKYPWTIGVPAVAKIGEVTYPTLAEAIAAVTTNEATLITMIGDETITTANGVTIATGKNITIDLDGHDITANLTNTGACAVFNIKNGATLTMQDDNTDCGQVVLTSSTVGSWPTPNVATNVFTNEGTLIIKGGYYENKGGGYCCYVVDNNSNTGDATLTVDGGKLVAQYSTIRTYLNNTNTNNNVTINGGDFVGKFLAYFQQPSANISSPLNCTVNDCTFEYVEGCASPVSPFYFGILNDGEINFALNGGKYKGIEGKAFVNVDGYNDFPTNKNISVTGGIYSHNTIATPITVKAVDNTDEATKTEYPYTVKKEVAQIVETEKTYSTLEEAIAAVPDGTQQTIKILEDILLEASVSVPYGKDIVLELNGKTLSYFAANATWDQLIYNAGILTIQDNTDVNKDGTGTGIIVNKGLKPDVQPIPNYATNTISNKGTLTIKSGKIENLTEDGSACYAVDNLTSWWDKMNTVTFNLEGGLLYRPVGVACRMNMACEGVMTNNVNISGGIIKSSTYPFWAQVSSGSPTGNLNITGGYFISENGAAAFLDSNYGTGFDNVSYHFENAFFKGEIRSESKKNFLYSGYYSVEGKDEYVVEGKHFISNTDPATKDEYGYIIGNAVCRVVKIEKQYVQLSPSNDAEYAQLKQNEDVYNDVWNLWGAKGFKNDNGDECPQYLLVSDNVSYYNADHTDKISGVIADDYMTTGEWRSYYFDNVYGYQDAVVYKYYATLAEGVDAAQSNQTVQLLEDIELSAQQEIAGKEIILDLNGKNISYTGSTIKGGLLLVHNGAGLTVANSVETVGSIASEKVYTAIALTGSGDNATNAAKLTVNNGTLKGYYYAVCGNGQRHNTEIVVNGGLLTTFDPEGAAIYNPQNGTISVTGGEITSGDGIYMKSGSFATFTGGTIHATGAKGTYNYQGSGSDLMGDAIVVDNCNYPGGKPSVTITSGTLISDHGYQVGAYFYSPETEISDIYSSNNTLTVPEGYVWKKYNDTLYKLTLADPVAKIGETTYPTIQAAVDAAKTGEKVVVIADVAVKEYVNIGKSIDIDLNGHTITGPAESDKSYVFVYEFYDGTNPSVRISGSVYNGTINCNKIGVYSADHSDVTVKDLTIVQTKTDATADTKFNHSALAASYGSTLTVNSGSYTGNYAAGIFSTGGTITINGGTLTGSEHAFDVYTPTSKESESNSLVLVTNGRIAGDVNIHSGTGHNGYTASVSLVGGIYSTKPDTTHIAYGRAAVHNTDYGTKEAYPWTLELSEVKVEEKKDAEGKSEVVITSDDEHQQSADDKEAVAETLNNPTVSGKTGTNVDAGTQTKQTEVKTKADEGSIDSQVKITLESATTVTKQISTASMVVVNSMVFDVKPVVTYTTTVEEVTTTHSEQVSHTDVPVTFRLPIDMNLVEAGSTAVEVFHRTDDAKAAGTPATSIGIYPILAENDDNYVELTAQDFSEYSYKYTESAATKATVYYSVGGVKNTATIDATVEEFNKWKTNNPKAVNAIMLTKQDLLSGAAAGTVNNIVYDNGSQKTATNVVLMDGSDYYAPFNYTAGHISYTRNFPTGTWQAVCLPFNVTSRPADTDKFATLYQVVLPDDEEEGYAKGIKVVVNKTINKAANTPFVFKTSSETTTFSETNAAVKSTDDMVTPNCATTMQDFDFVGVYGLTNMYQAKGWYLSGGKFSWDPDGSSKVDLKAFRFYMYIYERYDKPASYYPISIVEDASIKLVVFGDEETDIEEMEVESDVDAINNGNEAIYNLSGQKLNKLQKGFNIVNGKKIFVK